MSDLSLRYLLFGEDRTASSTIHKVGANFSKMGSTIGGEFGELVGKMGEAFEHLDSKQKNLGAKLTAGGGAMAGIGAALSFIGSADKRASDQLKQAVKASGHDYEEYGKSVEEAVKHQENFGHSAVDTQTALRVLTQATNDPKKALDEMGLVANLAAAKHISLADASDKVAKILGGRGSRTLAEYGIHLTKNKDGTVNVTKALDELSKKTDGQASASMNNFGAKVDVVKTKLEDWAASTGQKLGPVLMAMGPALMVVGSAMEIYTARQAAAAVATEATTVAQTELDVAMDANPIGLVVIAIAALVGGFILAYKHSETFRRIVQAAFHAVAAAFEFAWDKIKAGFSWLTGHWKLVLSILTGPIGAAVIFIASHFDQIVNFVKGVPKRIGSAASGMWDGIKNAFRAAINWIIRGWDSLHFRMPSVDTHIPGVGKVGGFDLGLPQIPQLALGGIVMRPTLAVVGERGPEAVVPLNRLGGMSSGPQAIHLYIDGREVRATVKRQERLAGGIK